jgi:hypothetical protein
MSLGPSVTKIRSLPALSWRERTFVRATHPLLAAWLSDADVVSEGAITPVGDVKTYFGTTQVRLPWAKAPDVSLRDARAFGVLAHDPHLRVLLVRMARREALARGGALAVLRVDLSFSTDAIGFIALADVDARAIDTSRSALHP